MAAKKPVLALAGVPRVNLLPGAEVDRRERLSLTRVWALLCVVAVLVAAAVVGGAVAFRWAADQRLTAEQERTNKLLIDVAQYSDISQSVKGRSELEAFRETAMANDFEWTPVINAITAHLPKGVTLAEFNLAPGGAPTKAEATVQVGAFGTLTLRGPAPSAQSATVKTLSAVPGVLQVDAGDLYTVSKSAWEFHLTISFDQSIYSGRFDAAGSK